MANIEEMTEEQQERVIAMFGERLDKLPTADRLGVLICANHIRNGANWGFDTDAPDGNKRYMQEISEDPQATKNIVSFQLNRGYVHEFLSFDKAVHIFRGVAGAALFDQKIENAAKLRKEEAVASLQKFLQDGKRGTVGFYNTNQSDTASKDGKTYPSFCLNAYNFFGVLSQADYIVKTANGTVASAKQAFQNLGGVMKELDKSPSSNAVLIDIQPRA